MERNGWNSTGNVSLVVPFGRTRPEEVVGVFIAWKKEWQLFSYYGSTFCFSALSQHRFFFRMPIRLISSRTIKTHVTLILVQSSMHASPTQMKLSSHAQVMIHVIFILIAEQYMLLCFLTDVLHPALLAIFRPSSRFDQVYAWRLHRIIPSNRSRMECMN